MLTFSTSLTFVVKTVKLTFVVKTDVVSQID